MTVSERKTVIKDIVEYVIGNNQQVQNTYKFASPLSVRQKSTTQSRSVPSLDFSSLSSFKSPLTRMLP
jgi:hypothetical protein